jgi:micrococcal nuclease
MSSLLRLAVAASLFATLTLALACNEEDDPSRPSPTLGINATAPPLSPTRVPAFPEDTTIATVTNVVDGDTIDVEIEGEEYRLRYIGIDTPETVDPRRPVECFGQAASDQNTKLVLGKTVGLEKDVSETDQFGRLLRYVWLNGSDMVNVLLVRGGYAEASAYPPDVKYQELLDAMESQAREAGNGLWGEECAETPTPTSLANAGATGCDFSHTAQSLIKGNISSEGEKIYHVPGGKFYEVTVVDEASGEVWFCTESDAIAAGWRKSLR